ncbi:hypothetical protein LVJ94_18950 [Pendulispora rubella]|uniref:Uncharacterized protein n=1 Tax=Pendulispora rubella TaxID=2741070 RepID=A0ABZ2LHQ1_9BACT
MSRTYRWKLALSAVLFGGIAVLSTQGCTITTSDDPIDGGGSNWEPWDGKDAGNGNWRATCEGCNFDWCRSQWSTCQEDSECHKIYSCSIGCDKVAPADYNQCTKNCYDQYPAGKTNYRNLAVCNQFYSCSRNACQSICQDTADYCNAPAPEVDAGSSTPPPAPAPQSCFDCTTARCRAEKTRCSPGSSCEAYSKCTDACGAPNVTDPFQCVDDCGLARPDGKADSEAQSNCTTNQCRSECGL